MESSVSLQQSQTSAPSRILVISFSQTGESARVAQVIAEPLRFAGNDVIHEVLRPMQSYPFPWRNPVRFFDVLPECLLGPAPAMQPVTFDTTVVYDLIILVYQVWFLSPSLPVQGFLASPAAAVLRDRPVITVSVSRNMWQSASEKMKRLLHAAGAVQIDNVAVTHQGPPWATFVTTPRALLFGKTEPFWGIFPAAGLGAAEVARVQGIGEILRERWANRSKDEPRSLLHDAGAIHINYRYMVPEAVGWHVFMAWAWVIKTLGRCGRWLRTLGICCFMVFLVCAVTVGIPLLTLLTLLLTPFVRKPMTAYAARLAAPSGTAIAAVSGGGTESSEN